MIDPGASKLWYGRHETPDHTTPVIYDPTLPGMPSGQVYLYNAARDAMVPYQLSAVERFLKAADKEETRDLKQALGKRFKAVRKEYLKTYRQAERDRSAD